MIDERIEIDAPPEVVWATITDLPRYAEWNPFIVSCRSTLIVGDALDMRVRLFSGFTQPQRETLFEHVPRERLCYGIARNRLGALASRRSHELEAAGAGRTRYRSHFELSGWLAPVVRGLLGTRLEHGFHAMTDALRRRAEGLWAERGAGPPSPIGLDD